MSRQTQYSRPDKRPDKRNTVGRTNGRTKVRLEAGQTAGPDKRADKCNTVGPRLSSLQYCLIILFVRGTDFQGQNIFFYPTLDLIYPGQRFSYTYTETINSLVFMWILKNSMVLSTTKLTDTFFGK
jgi:hypothetical protein